MKSKQILLLLTAFLGLFSSCSKAQNTKAQELLENTETSLSKIKNVVFKTNRIDKFFSSTDTLYRTAICSLYISSKDKIGMHFVTNEKAGTDSIYYRIYNGNYLKGMYIFPDNVIKSKEIENTNVEHDKSSIEGNIGIDLLSRSIFDVNQNFTTFKDVSEQDNIEKMEVHEEILQNTPVYVLTISFKNHENSDEYINNGIDKYYIRKKDFLPIAYSTYGEFQGMKEYSYVTIDYLAINTLSIKDFEPYKKVEDVNIKGIYEQTKILLDKGSFSNVKNKTAKKKELQKTVKLEIKNNTFPLNEFLLNNDKTIRLSDLKGKVVLLDFWYRGCLPCIKTIPNLIKLQEEFNEDLVIIGINDVDIKEDVTEFQNYKKINYLSTYRSEINISKSLNFNSFPTLIIINQKGEIVKTEVGYSEESTLSKTIKDLIKNNK
ncbi:MAG: TlpA disulfide reductase family protein [Myroides sp.]